MAFRGLARRRRRGKPHEQLGWTVGAKSNQGLDEGSSYTPEVSSPSLIGGTSFIPLRQCVDVVLGLYFSSQLPNGPGHE